MNAYTKRTLLLICRRFLTLDAPARTWLLARLQSDHSDLMQEERRAA